MTESIPKCNLCGTELPDPKSPCECTPGELPYKPSDEAVEWVGCNLSYQSALNDWILSGCQAFDAGQVQIRDAVLRIINQDSPSEWTTIQDIKTFLEEL